MCTVHIVGRYNGVQFEDRDVALTIGEASEVGVVDGVEQALKKFKKGEKSILQVNSRYAYDTEGNAAYNIPPGANLEYEVELKKFEKVLQIAPRYFLCVYVCNFMYIKSFYDYSICWCI